jgi:hypothetical protein
MADGHCPGEAGRVKALRRESGEEGGEQMRWVKYYKSGTTRVTESMYRCVYKSYNTMHLKFVTTW